MVATQTRVRTPLEPPPIFRLVVRGDTNEYVARILPDASKLHGKRTLDPGSDVMESRTKLDLAFPRVQ